MLKLWTATDDLHYKKIVAPALAGQDIELKKIKLDGSLPKLKDGDTCLGFGGKALQVLQRAGLVPKNRALGSMRETEIPVNNGKARFLLTYDPAIVSMDYARKPEIQWDVRLAVRRQLTGTIKPKIGNYRYVKNFGDAVKYVLKKHEITKRAVPIAVDLETIGLTPYAEDVRIVSISVTYKKGQADVMHFKKTDELTDKQREQITFLLTSQLALTRGANFKFDQGWMAERWGIECTNFKFDTLLVGSLLDENRNNSLNLHAKIFTDMGGYDDDFNKTHDKSRMDLVKKKDLLPYAGGDTDACQRTANVLRKQLVKDKRLANFYIKLVQPSSQAFAKMEHRGMVVDIGRYQELRVHVQSELERLQTKAFSMMPRKLRLKYSDNLALTRDVILREFLFTKKGLNLKPQEFTPKPDKDGNPRPSCAMSHLELFSDRPEAKEFVQTLREYNSAKKTMGTYIDGFMRHLRADGKFHPSYMLHRGEYEGDGEESGAVTGRTSCKDPAFQTIPKHTIWTKPLRSVYVPPPGHVILQVDYSQGELRVVACVAQEPTMIKAYKEGIDLHSITAARLVGMDFEDFMNLPDDKRNEYRFGGKAGNFGLLYGMGWFGFQTYARNQYGVDLSDAKAQQFREDFFDLYGGLADYHDEMKAFAHLNGFVRSPLGRVRHLPLINTKNQEVRARQERQSINSPIQSTLSDLCQLAMVQLDRMYPELWMFGMTHDSINMYIPEDQQDVWVKRVVDVMENLPLKDFGWKPALKFVADAEIGVENLSELKPFDLAA